ncbi:MAG: DUF599 family protein [Comamonas sp.]
MFNLQLSPVFLTLALVGLYFIKHWWWSAPATRLHEQLRAAWLDSVSNTQGTEILGVQTIRNSLMSCTMTATAATLAFMGGVSLLYNSWTQTVPAADQAQALQQMIAMFAVLVLLGLSFITSMLSARQWHHTGFVAGMPVGSAQRKQWLRLGEKCLRKAGHYYALSVRLLMWCVPLVVTGLFAWAGVVAAAMLLVLLWQGMDR